VAVGQVGDRVEQGLFLERPHVRWRAITSRCTATQWVYQPLASCSDVTAMRPPMC
jgi:hypothetical protein